VTRPRTHQRPAFANRAYSSLLVTNLSTMPRCVWLLGFAAIVSIFMLSTECFRGKHIPRCKPFSKSVPLGLDPVPIEMYRKRTVESRQSTNFGDECSIPLVAVVLLDARKSSIPNTLSMFLSAFPKAHAVVVTSSSAHALAEVTLGATACTG
jgi:hypothetical protein